MIIGSKELIRDINNNLILETIIEKSPISRAALSKELGLTKATISTIVQELIDKLLVVEIGSDNTDLGRKPILLTYNKLAGHALCIDIQPDNCSTMLSDLQANVTRQDTIPTPEQPKDLPQALIQYVKGLLAELPPSPYGLVGITLSVHGVTYENHVKFAPYYNLSGLHLAGRLEDELNIPTYLENEANLSALGENTMVHDISNLASISVHSGIGLGLIMKNHLVKGYKGYAGEVGHTIIDIDGRACPCGNHGCLEQYVSEKALLKEFAAMKGKNEASFQEFIKAYENEDADAEAIVNLFVKYMSVGLNNIINSYNPEVIILNSSFTSLYPNLSEEIIKKLTSKMNNYSLILPSSLHGKSSLVGGLCVAIKNFLGIKYLKMQNNFDPDIL